MTATREILVVGAGPTGLGAAWRLAERGVSAWEVVEATDSPGGLAASVVDEQGFTWDLGGHVLFSHYRYFDRLMDVLGLDWVEHARESWVQLRGQLIPYPLQNNLWRLPSENLLACLEGLVDVHAGPPGTPPATFHDWILATFGQGLANVFLLPYNRKVWAYEPSVLGTGWMGERVATVDLKRVLRNVVLRRDDRDWGPNRRFRYPLRGGTGAIWRAVHARLPPGRVTFRAPVTAVLAAKRRVRCADGSERRFDALVSSMPLDRLLGTLTDRPDLAARAKELVHSSIHLVGIGVAGRPPEALATLNWIYCPEPEVPFHRVTVFSNYSPYNVPNPGRAWSLLCEVSESAARPVDPTTLVGDVLASLRHADLLPSDSVIVSRWHHRVEHGYPTPFRGRDALLEELDGELRHDGIFSRGRFGAWKYEASNQDHSLMMGVEVVDHVLSGTEETTFRRPDAVNAGRGQSAAEAALQGEPGDPTR